jgi:hypothetical protein
LGAPDQGGELKESKVRIYFNNNARAKSVRNAFLLVDMLLIEQSKRRSSYRTSSPSESSNVTLGIWEEPTRAKTGSRNYRRLQLIMVF